MYTAKTFAKIIGFLFLAGLARGNQFNYCTGCIDFTGTVSSSTLPGGSTQYIQNRETLQSGATFYVSSGTVITLTTTGTYTASGNVNLSSGVLLSGAAGAIGQMFTSGGAGTVPTWTTPSGGGASSLAIATGTVSGFTATNTSPTAVINFDAATISAPLKGAATAFVSLLPSSVTLQGNTYSISGIAVDTGTLTTRIVAVGVSTAAIAVSTGALQTTVNTLGASTQTLAVSTGTLYTLANTKVAYSSFSAVSPISYNSATGAIGATLISLSTQVVGTLPAANMVSTAAFTVSTQTFSGTNTFSSTTFNGNVNISSGVKLSGSAGTSGQVLTSGGDGAIPTWTTSSGGSGIVSPGTFTWSNTFGMSLSTLTVTSTSTLAYVTLSTFTASSGTVTNDFYAQNMWASQALLTPYIFLTPTGGSIYLTNQDGLSLATILEDGAAAVPTLSFQADYYKFANLTGDSFVKTDSSSRLTTVDLYGGTNSWTGTNTFSSTTFNGNVSISSGVKLSGSAGASGQVLTSGGAGTVPTWTTPSGGGASALAIATGTTAGFTVPGTSPTAVVNLDQSQFSASLKGAATGFITIAYSTAAVTGSTTLTSTQSVVIANCSSACTQTLPTAAGISGKRYAIKMINAGSTQVTVATTSSQTIDGATTQILYLQYTTLDVISDGSNWSIL